MQLPVMLIDNSYNVANSTAKEFYLSHGAERVESAMDLQKSFDGEVVMQTRYCIRREIGECLKERPEIKGELWLERGGERYRLEFDCEKCQMNIRR